MTIYHTHHIIPKHMGGTDDPSNLISLTIEEHAEAHRLLWEQHGRKQDYYAWKGLSGAMGKDDIIKNLISHRGESHPFYGKKHTEESKAKMSKLKKESYKGAGNPMFGKKRPDLSERNKKGNSLETRAKISSKMGGRIWISRGEEEKLVSSQDLEKYLIDGFRRGRCRH